MLMADTVMDADEPRFQIGEDEMDDRQIVLGNLWVADQPTFRVLALGNGKVFIPALAEAGISTPISVTVSVLGATALSTNPQSESALRSGTTASLTRPA